MLTYQDRDVDKVLKDCSAVTLNPETVDIASFMEHFMYNKENIHFGGLLYKVEILREAQIRFTPGVKYGEDLEFAWKYMVNCKNGAILLDKMYGYYNNPASAINTVRWEKNKLGGPPCSGPRHT